LLLGPPVRLPRTRPASVGSLLGGRAPEGLEPAALSEWVQSAPRAVSPGSGWERLTSPAAGSKIEAACWELGESSESALW